MVATVAEDSMLVAESPCVCSHTVGFRGPSRRYLRRRFLDVDNIMRTVVRWPGGVWLGSGAPASGVARIRRLLRG